MNNYIGFMNNTRSRADNAADIQVADRIMHAMIVKGLTLKDLADETGISYSTLRRSLHQDRPDRRSITFQEFHKIAAALSLQPSALLPDTLAARDAA